MLAVVGAVYAGAAAEAARLDDDGVADGVGGRGCLFGTVDEDGAGGGDAVFGEELAGAGLVPASLDGVRIGAGQAELLGQVRDELDVVLEVGGDAGDRVTQGDLGDRSVDGLVVVQVDGDRVADVGPGPGGRLVVEEDKVVAGAELLQEKGAVGAVAGAQDEQDGLVVAGHGGGSWSVKGGNGAGTVDERGQGPGQCGADGADGEGGGGG